MDALMDDEQDVGLYGEQLDEDMQSYENEGSDENIFEAENEEMEGEEDNIIEDNFDHFRQVELKNDETDSKQQKSKL